MLRFERSRFIDTQRVYVVLRFVFQHYTSQCIPMVQGNSKLTAADWLEKFDWDDLIDLKESTRWFDEVKGELNVQSLGYTGITKPKGKVQF